ncbi:MAG: hypothetical protein IT445_09650 [Phycisphaeraceae bacterium]|nr:hypothetical protein [Phycisphaeraceae bacterium]
MAGSIFDKQAILKPSAMATVAERRYADAQALVSTKDNARANGAAYLAGFVIEILLKAQLVREYPEIAKKRPHQVEAGEREIWALIWRQHDLEAMLHKLPQLEAALKKRGEVDGTAYLESLRKICARWTIQARYSPDTILMNEAARILEMVRSLKELLK